MTTSTLRPLFEPASVAVIGVNQDEHGVGRRVFRNIRQGGFQGPIYGVHPSAPRLDGERLYASASALPGAFDLAVIAVPARAVPDVLEECALRGARAAIVLSAGYGESGEAGVQRQRELVAKAHALGIRILGPNCLGIMRAPIALNASFSRGIGITGKLALVSQSGAVCSAVVDWAEQRRIGLSTVVSLGAAADVGAGDVLDYLALDPSTDAILMYLEGVDHARSFLSGVRAAARNKPVIVVKAGRHEAANRAAASHTGAIVGNDAVFDAALRRTGAVRVATLHELFAAADVLSHSKRTSGSCLAIITNAGGLGVLAADRAGDLDVTLAPLSDATRAALERALPAHAATTNPVDVLGDAPPERYGAALAACLADAGIDGVIVLLTPQAMTRPEEVAIALAEAEGQAEKPVLACFMGGNSVDRARTLLVERGVACFDSPEAAVEAFATLATFARNQRNLLQLPNPSRSYDEPDVAGGRKVIAAALHEGRTALSQSEAFAMLSAFGIEHVASERAATVQAAVSAADRIGYPVALKIDSPDIVHKTDIGGVRLGIADEAALRAAHAELVARIAQNAPHARIDGVVVQAMLKVPEGRELLVGVSRDKAFGPAIACGAGGTLVEIMGGAAIELPPLTTTLARNLWQRARAAPWLGAFRGMRPADVDGLERTLLRVSDMVCELEALDQLDINPLVVGPDRVIALDARIALNATPPAAKRYAHLAIAPYPRELDRTAVLADGLTVRLRALRPEDGELEQRFISGLSFETKYLRFLHGVGEPSARMLARLTQLDYDRELAIIAEVADVGPVGVGRYVTEPTPRSCEFALVVADAYQGRGIGHLIMTALIDAAREAGFDQMRGDVLATNRSMLALMHRQGFTLERDSQDKTLVQARRSLGTT
jgi:acetyltransferase